VRADPVVLAFQNPGVFAREWPTPVAEAALTGLAGDVVKTLMPHTEADQHAILVQFLAGFGSAVGNEPHFAVEADRHGTNLFVVLVGKTAKGRKGTSWGQTRKLLELADEDWALTRIQSGLSSGEGLIWAVRDAVRRPDGGRARAEGRDEHMVDEGVADKRLLVLESEFASPLCVMRREGNTLSAIVRLAWETGNLRVLTKNAQAVATGAHISIIGHITQAELNRHLGETEAANGFANRFLWLCVKRSKVLPEGGSLQADELQWLACRLRDAMKFARNAGGLRRDDEARELWRTVYPALSNGQTGLYGAITSRSEAQVMRLALIYALLDQSAAIGRRHLEAALALWTYSDASCRYIFGSALGDPVADALLVALRQQPDGMTRTQVRDYFGRHARSADLDRALGLLREHGLVTCQSVGTGGRPAERWFATQDATYAR